MKRSKPSCSSHSHSSVSSSNSSEEENSETNENETVIKKSKKYDQNYNHGWEDEADLRGGVHFAHACDIDINIKSGKLQLHRHAQREKHKNFCRSKVKQRSLLDFMPPAGLDTQVKNSVLILTAFVVEHNLPMKLMDHVPDLLRAVCPDSKIAKSLKSARTKTTNIIKNVMGLYSFRAIIEVLKNNKFSLIIDETTDRATIKHMCLVVRVMFNDNVSDCFLTLLPVESAQAEVLFHQIVAFFVEHEIPYIQNLIGFASDGASNMMGRHSSVASRFLAVIPEIFILKCICHSFALCASYACNKLPNFVETFTRDVHNYFSNSPKRISQFKAFQDFCNIKAHKILHPCQTRWLSVLNACSNNREDKQADIILQSLNNSTCKLYLQFLEYILPLFVNLNRQMQSENPQISNIYSSITTVVKTILDCFIKPEVLRNASLYDIDYKNLRNMLPLEQMYFGAAVASNSLDEHQLHSLKTNCLSFYIEGVNQILRFPLKNNPLQDLSFLNPQSVRAKTISSIANIAKKWPNLVAENKLQILDNEWRLLRNYDAYPDTNNVLLFWSEIAEIKCGYNTDMFRDLTKFIFNICIGITALER
ncbi:hypothetical protein NQ317_007934 [Molorchus minor]|uniref:DUF4371 domain-containing protein n=1 Tax=Molorchus minor TaxID=1323400 RepID=A0ABQ9JSF7_9CUCU|nr:hypothetical protein NQ317_007934 [Molorchus minor]